MNLISWFNSFIQPDLCQRIDKGSNSKVLILDTGIDYKHPYFKTNTFVIKDFINQTDPSPMDTHGHGTHIASLFVGDNGISPMANIYIGKVTFNHKAKKEALIKAIDFAITHGIDLISMSLGSSHIDQDLSSKINEAYHKGIIIVAAASNDSNEIGFPASHHHVVSVAAINESFKPMNYYHDFNPNIFAPGSNIYGALPSNRYGNLSGSSIATGITSACLSNFISYSKTCGVPINSFNIHHVFHHALPKISDSFYDSPINLLNQFALMKFLKKDL
ncbi:subtilisin-like serine protease [Bacillus phage vB_BauM_KLEB27-3]|nr:subtilisin-like serine protease [Bacillus phage vB_BauM_KLEB27-3]